MQRNARRECTAFTIDPRCPPFASVRFIPPDQESEMKERLTYDLKYHGTDGARDIVCCWYDVECDDVWL